MTSKDLSTHPLHFATRPPDAPAGAELVGMGLLVAWAAHHFGLPKKHAKSEVGKQLLGRTITPRTFLVTACKKTLTSEDVDPKLVDFLYGYTNRMFLGEDARDATDKPIAKLLRLGRADERAFTDDFLGTFKTAVPNPFLVPDSWDAVERITPILDARWFDYQKTKFEASPDLSLYETAAKLRDAKKLSVKRAKVVADTVDHALTEELIALVDRPLSDKAVQAVLSRAGLPIGKKIDEQANPRLGVSYMGAKFAIAGKRVMGVDSVCFYANKQKSYIRGLKAEVQFVGYPGVLPNGLAFGALRAAVVKKLGTPKESGTASDVWYPSKHRRVSCLYARGKLVSIEFGKPRDW
ncbi:MAG: hypothetical protein H0T79_14225 [Deltaproteobacteria bacterium]|nr:hypothetical protein [Deltaproteobacteria bacterium]